MAEKTKGVQLSIIHRQVKNRGDLTFNVPPTLSEMSNDK